MSEYTGTVLEASALSPKVSKIRFQCPEGIIEGKFFPEFLFEAGQACTVVLKKVQSKNNPAVMDNFLSRPKAWVSPAESPFAPTAPSTPAPTAGQSVFAHVASEPLPFRSSTDSSIAAQVIVKETCETIRKLLELGLVEKNGVSDLHLSMARNLALVYLETQATISGTSGGIK